MIQYISHANHSFHHVKHIYWSNYSSFLFYFILFYFFGCGRVTGMKNKFHSVNPVLSEVMAKLGCGETVTDDLL